MIVKEEAMERIYELRRKDKKRLTVKLVRLFGQSDEIHMKLLTNHRLTLQTTKVTFLLFEVVSYKLATKPTCQTKRNYLPQKKASHLK